MPASIKIAGTGATTYVSGSSIEMVVKAPIPGRTPIRLPIRTPNTDHIRLPGCSAMLKPYQRSMRFWCMSELNQVGPSVGRGAAASWASLRTRPRFELLPLEQGQLKGKAKVENDDAEPRERHSEQRRP